MTSDAVAGRPGAAMVDLAQSWSRAWRGIGASGTGAGTCSALRAAYAEPHRHYHTMQHLVECLATFDEVADLAESPHAVELAIWFHDAIYAPGRSGNEERSAELAQRELESSGVDAQAARHVHDLVLATRHDALPVSRDEKVLVDIDLSILGADELRFSEYECQVREEYVFVPGWLFRRKRRAILQSFIERDFIYSTPYFIETLEARARANLRRALGEQA